MTRQAAEVHRMRQALGNGQFDDCIALATRLIETDPKHQLALEVRASAHSQTGALEEALADLGQLIRIYPDVGAYFLQAGACERLLGRWDAALETFSKASEFPEHVIRAGYEKAVTFNHAGRPDEASAEYEALLERDPRHANANANLAALLEQRNQLAKSRQHCEQALESDASNRVAILTMAILERREGRPDSAIRHLQTLLRDPKLSPHNRALAMYQLGQSLERLNLYRDALRAFTEANSLLARHHAYGQPDPDGPYGLQRIRKLATYFQSRPEPKTPELEPMENPPVFLLGFPRSGTTLMDQILSAHPAITVLEEQELFLELRERFVDGENYRCLHELDSAAIADGRALYLNARRRATTEPANVIIDKLPLNGLYLGVIERFFPEARIIVALRDPRDVVMSCFTQAFDLVGAMPYFLSLDGTVSYYREAMSITLDYVERSSLGRAEIRYEELVGDLEGSIRPILGFLDLPWTNALHSYRDGTKNRLINTPSYQQVVKPLYTQSIGRWQRFAPHLGDALAPLEELLQRLDYS